MSKSPSLTDSSKLPDITTSTKPYPSEGPDGPEEHRSRWQWKGTRSKEQKLLLKLDFYIMSWACFGYFLRLLDTSNMSNEHPCPHPLAF